MANTYETDILTLGQDDIIAFMQRLINAGMSAEEVAKQGFIFAMELSENEYGRQVPKIVQMERASIKLERAARATGIHLSIQREMSCQRG